MNILIIGAGMTGLSAALRLLQKGHRVTILGKEKVPGGMTSSFRRSGWKFGLEKAYHLLIVMADNEVVLLFS